LLISTLLCVLLAVCIMFSFLSAAIVKLNGGK
jgi:hypothetical protein